MKKKVLSVLLAAMLLVSLAACGSTAAPEGSTTPSSTPSDESADDKVYTVGISQLIQHPALDAATQGFKDALTEKLGDKVKFEEHNASGDIPTAAVIANQLVSANVDLIMANATATLQAAQTATSTIPVLGTSVTDYATALDIADWTGKTGTNVSGTSDLAPLDQQAAVIQELFPLAKNVGILYCSGEPNSKYQSTIITGYLTEMGYSVKEYTFTDSNDLQTVTVAAAADSEVIYVPTDNTVASNTEIIKNVTVPAGVPVVAGEEGICSGTGIATLSISYYDLGYQTGLMAYEVLANKANPGEMEVQFAPATVKKYNAEIVEKLGIEIPADYEMIAID